MNEQLSGQKERIVNVDVLRGPGMSLTEAPRGRFALAMQTIGFRFSPICPHLFLLEFDGHTLVPDTPLYRISEAVDRVEVTPGRFKNVPAPIESYASARPFSEAPASMQKDVVHGGRERFQRSPKYAPGTDQLAAVYSIAKVQVGVTRIPLRLLERSSS